ncbi:Site-specific recombinase XerD [Chryseobacterium taichungense]|uniref:Site-specific recombinase XerD n=1 Tax=Chryseobacterium taichungense TaxID=295069 RepID=A0A1H8A4E6_9FLAO|nr:site-specific integrase [Chryseobacterium taichungense]SEM65570.1 Site-specific recombinase XerD [Chryseobacterium taichungense]
MISFQFTLKSTTKVNGEKSIIISFIKDRKNTSLSLQKSCREDQWSYETERVKKNHPEHKKINAFIEKYHKIIEEIIEQFEDDNISYTLPDLINRIKTYKGKNKTVSYTEFQLQNIENLKKSSKIGTAQIENETLKSLQLFFKKKDIGFNEITYLSLKNYEAYCTEKGNKSSTIGIRLRTVRNIFNQAIKGKIIKETQYPFKDFKLSKIKTNSKKEYLTQDEIRLLKNYETKEPKEEFARDMFLFSYYSRGINFIDLIKLEKKSLLGSTIHYIRTKTGASVSFKLTDLNKSILEKYDSESSSNFLFRIIKNNNTDEIYLKNKCHKYLKEFINKPLKEIIKNLKINKNITYYCARHSFATALKFENVSIDIIKEALGHKDINSTMSYLNTLPDTKLDKIIEDIII